MSSFPYEFLYRLKQPSLQLFSLIVGAWFGDLLDQLHDLYLAEVALLGGGEVDVLAVSQQEAFYLVLTGLDLFAVFAHEGFSVAGLERSEGLETRGSLGLDLKLTLNPNRGFLLALLQSLLQLLAFLSFHPQHFLQNQGELLHFLIALLDLHHPRHQMIILIFLLLGPYALLICLICPSISLLLTVPDVLAPSGHGRRFALAAKLHLDSPMTILVVMQQLCEIGLQ